MKIRGFTLVEILVVVAVIGILASVVAVAGSEARAQARDRERQHNLKELQLAVELYKEANDVYPLGCNGSGVLSGGESGSAVCSPVTAEYIVGITPSFLPSLPRDPNTSGARSYAYISDGLSYKIMARRTVESIQIDTKGVDFARCPASCGDSTACTVSNENFYETYAVYGGNGDFNCN